MRNHVFLALFLGLFLFSASSFKTPAAGEKEFILCIVQGEYSQQQGIEMAQAFKKQYPATSVCRLDGTSKKFFVVYEAEKVSRDNVIDFFSGKKLHATCLHKGIYGKDQVPNLSAEECK